MFAGGVRDEEKERLSRRWEEMGSAGGKGSPLRFLLGGRKAVLFPLGRVRITCSPSESVSSIWEEPQPRAGVSLQC